jgi:hypothetical protein
MLKETHTLSLSVLPRPGQPQMATVPPTPCVIRGLLGTPLGMARICNEPGKCSMAGQGNLAPALALDHNRVQLITKGNPAS